MKKWFIGVCLTLMLIGCANNDALRQSDGDDSLELTKLSVRGVTDQQPSDQAKEFLSHYEEVAGVRAVNHEGQLLIAVDVKHHDRFSLDTIEKDLRKDVRENFSNMKITLSTDKKIFIELKQLEEDMLAQNVTEDDIKNRLKKIKKLSKEET